MPLAPPQRVQLFITCIVDSIFPQVGEAVVSVLEKLGVEVEFPEAQTCCGQPGYNAGFRAEAKQLALNFLEVFEKSDTPIVTPSGSCAAMVVHGYPDLFADDPKHLARARALAGRTYEFSQFLVSALSATDLEATFNTRLTYHASCHLLRGLGVKEAATQLLSHVRGADVVPLPHADECCGFGGLFSIKHGDLSAAMLDKKLDNVRATGASTVVGCDMSCLLHMQGGLSRDGTPIKCVHLAEVLASTGQAATAGEGG